jgi:hypothetical protein
MGADFICLVVAVDKPQTYWVSRVALMSDTAIMYFAEATESEFNWEEQCEDCLDRWALVRGELVTGISIAYDPGRDGTWTQIDGKPYCVVGEHSWGDVSNTFESLRVFRDFQSYLELEEIHRANNETE